MTLKQAPPKCPTRQTYKTPSDLFQAPRCQEAGNVCAKKCQININKLETFEDAL